MKAAIESIFPDRHRDQFLVVLKIALVVFLVEIVIMLAIISYQGDTVRREWALSLIDATTLTVLISPIVLFWIIGPFVRERDKAADVLREREGRLAALAGCSPDGIITMNSLGIIKSFNPVAETLFGYVADEVLGKNVNILMPESSHSRHNAHLCAHVTTGVGAIVGAGPREVTGRRKDGSAVALELAVGDVKIRGERIIVAHLRDITERKEIVRRLRETERSLANIAGNFPGILYRRALRPDGRIEFPFVAGACLEIFGITAEEVMRNPVTFLDTVDPRDRAYRTETIHRIAETMEDTIMEFRITDHNGKKKWIRSFTRPHGREDGSVLYDGVIFDVTAEKQADARQAALESRLQRAEKMESIGTLAGGIAHEFNNLLAPIMLYTEMASDDVPRDSDTYRNLQKVLVNGTRAAELVSYILGFSRTDTTVHASVDLHRAVTGTIEFLKVTLPTSVTIRCDLDEFDGFVLAGEGQIQQILINLAKNAADALDGEVGELGIGLHRVEADNAGQPPRAKLSVCDNGPGMDAKTLKRIFEPFFTTKDVSKGTGLGLPIIHGIVTSMNGVIDVVSEPGHGTVFRIYLPLQSEDRSGKTDNPEGSDAILAPDADLAAPTDDIAERMPCPIS